MASGGWFSSQIWLNQGIVHAGSENWVCEGLRCVGSQIWGGPDLTSLYRLYERSSGIIFPSCTGFAPHPEVEEIVLVVYCWIFINIIIISYKTTFQLSLGGENKTFFRLKLECPKSFDLAHNAYPSLSNSCN